MLALNLNSQSETWNGLSEIGFEVWIDWGLKCLGIVYVITGDGRIRKNFEI